MAHVRGVEPADPTPAADRLELRRWRPEDAERVQQALSDPSMGEYLVLPERFDAAAARAWIERRRVEDPQRLDRAVIERSTGRVVGSAALWLPGDPNVGYWIAPDARGHGYAAEVAAQLAGWVFARGGPRVVLSCDVRNIASARTALAAGFTFEAVARSQFLGGGDGQPARHHDAARFARLASDPGDPVAAAFPPLPAGGLTDGVLALRPSAPGDATGYLECDDDESARWAFDAERRTAEDAERRMTRAALDWLVGRDAQCTLFDVASGRFAGELQVRFEGPPGVAGIGYAVHPAFRGRGYTTRALRLIVPWCFDDAGFARVELGAKAGNVASRRAALSAGFGPDGVRERRLRNADGTFADEVCFALVNPRHR